MMKFKISSAALLAVLLCACGGGSGGGGSAGGDGGSLMSATFTGKIIDGYIENALVCIDLNSSLSCDANEPSTRTKADGTYSLTYNGANPVGLPILAVVSNDSKDADDNGKTLAQTGKSPFNLAAPILKAENSEVIVSPLTTLVMHNVLSGMVAAPTQASILNSQMQVKRQLGISKDVLGVDVTKDPQLHHIAQVIALVLGDITKQANSSTKVAQMQAGAVLMEFILPGIIDNGAVKASVATALTSSDRSQVQSNLKAVLNTLVNYTRVVSDAKLSIAFWNNMPSPELVDIKQMLAAGYGGIETDSYYSHNSTQKPVIGNGSDNGFLKVHYDKYDSALNQFKSIERYWYAPTGGQYAWVKPIYGEITLNDMVLKSDGTWVNRQNEMNTGKTPILNANCATTPGIDSKNGGESVCITQVNIAGKKIADLVFDACAKRNGITPAESCASATFSEGSFGYNFMRTTLNDLYKVSVPSNAGNASIDYGNLWRNSPPATTIPAFITMMMTKYNASMYKLGIWNNFSIKFISYDEASATGEVNWYYGQDDDFSGTSKFFVKTINGQKILVIPPVALYYKNNPEHRVGEDFIFAAVDNKIRLGTVEYANTVAHIKFGLDGYPINSKAVDSILKAIGLSAFPYDQAEVVPAVH